MRKGTRHDELAHLHEVNRPRRKLQAIGVHWLCLRCGNHGYQNVSFSFWPDWMRSPLDSGDLRPDAVLLLPTERCEACSARNDVTKASWFYRGVPFRVLNDIFGETLRVGADGSVLKQVDILSLTGDEPVDVFLDGCPRRLFAVDYSTVENMLFSEDWERCLNRWMDESVVVVDWEDAKRLLRETLIIL